MNQTKYILVTWPESQELMTNLGFMNVFLYRIFVVMLNVVVQHTWFLKKDIKNCMEQLSDVIIVSVLDEEYADSWFDFNN